MISCNFDYFLKRANLLTEMARPVTTFQESSPTLKDAYVKISDYLLKTGVGGGTKGAGTRQILAFKWIIDNINNKTNTFTFDQPSIEGDGGVDTFPLDATSIIKQITGGQANPVNARKAAEVLARQNKSIINNPDFINQLLNFDALEAFKPNALSETGSRRKGKESELQNIVGKGIQETESEVAGVKELVNTMNRIMAGRKASKSKMGDKSKYANIENVPTQEEGGYNLNVEFSELVLDAIDLLLDDPSVSKIKSASGDLNFLDTFYKKTIEQGTGSSKEEFKEFMEKLKSMKGMTPERARIFDLLAQEVESLESDLGVDNFIDTTTSNVTNYEEYDKDVLAKFLDTPEKKSAFEKWYYNNKKWREAKLAKLEELWMKKMEALAYQNPKFAGAMQDKEVFVDNTINQWLMALAKYEDAKKKESDPARIELFDRKIKDMAEKIKDYKIQKAKNASEKEEQEESGVMDYMTEQVKKDTHTKTVNNFVDRGFKKPKNYWHWLEINK